MRAIESCAGGQDTCATAVQNKDINLKSLCSLHSLSKVKISAHQPNFFANKCLMSIYLIVTNENIGLRGHLRTMPIPLML